jgi:hypothetical protein
MSWIDKLDYGNPTIDQMKYLKNNEWNTLVASLLGFPFPKNSSEEVKYELETLLQYQEELKSGDRSVLNRYVSYDKESPIEAYKRFAKSRGLNIDKTLESIIEDSKYVIVGLKYKYQRPRPYQLGHYYKTKLTPYPSCVATTPSYPSGHTVQAVLLSSYLSAKLPNESEVLLRMAQDISVSRLYLGLHYSSDASFGIYVAKKITESEPFIKKYGKI